MDFMRCIMETSENKNRQRYLSVDEIKNGDMFKKQKGSKRFIKLLESHGQFCVEHSTEIIFAIISLVISLASISLMTTNLNDLPLSDDCYTANKIENGFDIFVLSMMRNIVVIYLYIQFSKLRSLGSKYMPSIVSILTILFSFIFSLSVLNLFGVDLSGLWDALPFFLLLIDLTKIFTIAKFALCSDTQESLSKNIGSAFVVIGPSLTLDCLVETLVVGVGTLSGIQNLRAICYFGCLSIVSNYFAFMLFYPAWLAILVELTREKRKFVEVQQLSTAWFQDEQGPSNPVIQKVKIIMLVGLLLVHTHSRLMGIDTHKISDQNAELIDLHLPDSIGQNNICYTTNSILIFLLYRLRNIGMDYLIPLMLSFLLTLKYIFTDFEFVNDYTDTSGDIFMPTKYIRSSKFNDNLNSNFRNREYSCVDYSEVNDINNKNNKNSVGENDYATQSQLKFTSTENKAFKLECDKEDNRLRYIAHRNCHSLSELDCSMYVKTKKSLQYKDILKSSSNDFENSHHLDSNYSYLQHASKDYKKDYKLDMNDSDLTDGRSIFRKKKKVPTATLR